MLRDISLWSVFLFLQQKGSKIGFERLGSKGLCGLLAMLIPFTFAPYSYEIVNVIIVSNPFCLGIFNSFELLIFVICKEFFHILNMDFIIYYKTIKFPKTTTIIVRTIIWKRDQY